MPLRKAVEQYSGNYLEHHIEFIGATGTGLTDEILLSNIRQYSKHQINIINTGNVNPVGWDIDYTSFIHGFELEQDGNPIPPPMDAKITTGITTSVIFFINTGFPGMAPDPMETTDRGTKLNLSVRSGLASVDAIKIRIFNLGLAGTTFLFSAKHFN